MSSGRHQNKRYPNGFSGQGGLDLSRLAAAQDAQRPDETQVIQVVTFDGFQFRTPQEITVVPYLEMAYRARRGDESAALTLNTFGIQLFDAARKPYWPMEVKQETVAEEPRHPIDKAARIAEIMAEESERLAPKESSILLPPGVEV